jgi:hypothetical protein
MLVGFCGLPWQGCDEQRRIGRQAFYRANARQNRMLLFLPVRFGTSIAGHLAEQTRRALG